MATSNHATNGFRNRVTFIISTNVTNVESTGHSGSSGILLMPVSAVVPEKLPGQKRCDEEKAEKEDDEFWGFLTYF